MRALEPRILLDAAAAETIADSVHQAIHTELADDYVESNFSLQQLPAASSNPDDPDTNDQLDLYVEPIQGSKQIIFIASDVEEIESSLVDLPIDAEVIVIDMAKDGVQQMADALAGRTDLDAIHIFSHGSEGELHLGNASLTWQSMLNQHTANLAMIGASLNEQGDILIYGCDFAEGPEGQYAAEILTLLTGADIAASTDTTGHQSNGGDWALEHHVGVIDTDALAADASWQGILSGEVLQSHEVPFADIDHYEPIGSDQHIGQTFKHSAMGSNYHVNQVDLVLRIADGAPLQDVTVEIRDGFSGPVLTTGTLSGSELDGDFAWHSVNLDSSVTLNNGASYVIRVSTSNLSSGVEVAVEHDVNYNFGDRLKSDGSPQAWHDLLFRVVGNNQNFDPVITSDGGLAAALLVRDENSTAVTDVVATDADVPADILSYSIVGGLDADKFEIDSVTGALAFLASPDFENPTDSNTNNIYTVTVQATDPWGGTDSQSISVVIQDINDVPEATGGTVTTDEEVPHVFDVAEFGFDDDEGDGLQSITVSNLLLAGGSLTHSGGTVVTNGMTISATEIASLTFIPATNSTTAASFDYTVNDADPGTVAAAMNIIVNPINDPPVATGGALATDEDVPYIFAIGDFGFSDVEGDGLQSITVSNLSLAGGTLTHTGGTITVTNGMTITAAQIADLTFAPAPDSNAAASLDYTVNDADPGATAAGMAITVNPINDPPVAIGGAVVTDEDETYMFSVSDFGFSDVEGDGLQSITISNLSLAGGTLTHTGGTITVTNGMTITAAQIADLTFAPAPDSNAAASFDYAVNDADPGATAAAMTITVSPVNDPPSAATMVDRVSDDSDAELLDVSTGFGDVDGDALTYSAMGLPTGLSIDPLSGVIGGTISKSASTDGPFAVQILATDPGGGMATALFNWSVNNPAPNAGADAFFGIEDLLISGNVAFNDSDPDGDAISFALETDSTNGTVVLSPDGSFTYQPQLDVNGNDAFTYRAIDADGASTLATVSLYLTPVNDRPVGIDISLTTIDDEPLYLGAGPFGFIDSEGDELQNVTFNNVDGLAGFLSYDDGASVVENGDTLTSGQLVGLTYVPVEGNAGTSSFSFTIHDAEGPGTPATLSVINQRDVGLVLAMADPVDIDPFETIEDAEEDSEEEIVIDFGSNTVVETLTHAAEKNKKASVNYIQQSDTSADTRLIIQPKIDVLQDAVLPTRAPSTPIIEDPQSKYESMEEKPAQATAYTFTRIDRPALMKDLDRVGDEMRQEEDLLGASVAKVTFTFGSLLSVGGVSFVLRSGLLATALMSAVPAWTRLDPISVVSGRQDEESDEEPSDVDMMAKFVSDARSRVRQESLL